MLAHFKSVVRHQEKNCKTVLEKNRQTDLFISPVDFLCKFNVPIHVFLFEAVIDASRAIKFAEYTLSQHSNAYKQRRSAIRYMFLYAL
jgi:hypothetical protein